MPRLPIGYCRTMQHETRILPEVTPTIGVTYAVPVLPWAAGGVPDIDLILTVGQHHVDVVILSKKTIRDIAIFTPDELVMRPKRTMMK